MFPLSFAEGCLFMNYYFFNLTVCRLSLSCWSGGAMNMSLWSVLYQGSLISISLLKNVAAYKGVRHSQA